MRLGESLKKVGNGLRARFGSSATVKRIAAWVEDGSGQAFQQLLEFWSGIDEAHGNAAVEGLLAFKDPELWDGLWLQWSQTGDAELGDLLVHRGVEAQTDDLREKSMLKLSREAEMPTGVDFSGTVMAYRDDPDLDVRRAVTRYWHRLEATNSDAYAFCCLLAGTYAKIGNTLSDVDRVLSLRTRSELGNAIEGYRRSLPRREAVYWDLQLGLAGKIRLDAESREILADFATGTNEGLSSMAQRAMESLQDDSPRHYLWMVLKVGDSPPSTIANLKTVARLVRDDDPDVVMAATAWIDAQPDAPRENDALYDAWLADDDRAALARLIESDKRPSNPSMRLLAGLLAGVDGFQLPDAPALAEQMADAWSRAMPSQREALDQLVETSGDPKLVDAYETAFGGRRDFDLPRVVRALTAVGDDDRLLQWFPLLSFGQGLEVLRRWNENDWLPSRDHDRAFVSELRMIAGQLAENEAETIPAEIPWLERYSAPSATPATDRPGVLWVDLAAGAVPEIMQAPLSGDPDEYEDYRSAAATLGTHAGALPKRLATLLALLVRIRGEYATAISVYEVST